MLFLTVAACVTINVYFPEAAAEEAADRFIDRIIGPDEESAQGSLGMGSNSSQSLALYFLDLVLPAAHAQANIDISTPVIQNIQSRMAARFDAELSTHFDSGAIGLTNDALIVVRDLAAVGLKNRNRLKAQVQADNKDRVAVYREIAVANGHPEWEQQIRQTFAQRWIARARSGWYYQDSSGNWKQK
jgi:uncharacterized protein YdbL (DUF1318 family)